MLEKEKMNKILFLIMTIFLGQLTVFSENQPVLNSNKKNSAGEHHLLTKMLFPIFNEEYPQPQSLIEKQYKNDEYVQKKSCIQLCHSLCESFVSKSLGDIEECQFAYLHVINTLPSTNIKMPSCQIGLVFYEDIYITISFVEDFIAFTFEFEDNETSTKTTITPEMFQVIQKIIPFLKNIELKPPTDQTFGMVLPLPNIKIDSKWIESVRWWYDPGKFGISFLRVSVPSSTAKMYYSVYPAPYFGPNYLERELYRNELYEIMTKNLFPMLNERYPKPASSENLNEYTAKKQGIENCRKICQSFLSEKIENRDNLLFVYLPSYNDIPARQIGIFLYKDIYITVSFVEEYIAFTFEFEDTSSKNIVVPEKTMQTICEIIPLLKRISLKKQTNREFGTIVPLSDIHLNSDWVESVRWWYSPGKFGISFRCIDIK
jgi:hypothetical protein